MDAVVIAWLKKAGLALEVVFKIEINALKFVEMDSTLELKPVMMGI